MLPKSLRFNPREIKQFFRNSKKRSFSCGSVWYFPSKEMHFSVMVSKTCVQKAVERNRIKRVVLEWLKENYSQTIKNTYNLHIGIQRKNCDEDMIKKSLYEVCKKLD